jgi:hypothetical protein
MDYLEKIAAYKKQEVEKLKKRPFAAALRGSELAVIGVPLRKGSCVKLRILSL